MTVAMRAWLVIASTHTDLVGAVPAAALVVCGVALTVGIFTSLCSALVGLAYVLVLFTPLDALGLPRLDQTAGVVGLGASAALGFLGPGAFSIDARLFGRRAIFIPASDDSEQS